MQNLKVNNMDVDELVVSKIIDADGSIPPVEVPPSKIYKINSNERITIEVSSIVNQKIIDISKNGKYAIYSDGAILFGATVYDAALGEVGTPDDDVACTVNISYKGGTWGSIFSTTLNNVNCVAIDGNGRTAVIVHQDFSSLVTKLLIYSRSESTFTLSQTLTIPLVDTRECRISDTGKRMVLHAKSTRAVHIFEKTDTWAQSHYIDNTDLNPINTSFCCSYDCQRFALADREFSGASTGTVVYYIGNDVNGVSIVNPGVDNFGDAIAMDERGTTLMIIGDSSDHNVYLYTDTSLSGTYTQLVSRTLYSEESDARSRRYDDPPAAMMDRHAHKLFVHSNYNEDGIHIMKNMHKNVAPPQEQFISSFMYNRVTALHVVSAMSIASSGTLFVQAPVTGQGSPFDPVSRLTELTIFDMDIAENGIQTISHGDNITLNYGVTNLIIDSNDALGATTIRLQPGYDNQTLTIISKTGTTAGLVVIYSSRYTAFNYTPIGYSVASLGSNEIRVFKYIRETGWIYLGSS